MTMIFKACRVIKTKEEKDEAELLFGRRFCWRERESKKEGN
jgi:ribosomal protein L35AE/L33A